MAKYFARKQYFTYSLAFLTGIFVILTYIWLISAGLWTIWPPTSNYYDQLATAFQHKQLSLRVTPDPALLALPNPYDPDARTGIPVVGDASLYKGKYYFYFGPTPAVLLSFIKPFFSAEIGDQYLVFVFTTALFIFQVLLIVLIYERHFRDIPAWTVPLCVLVAGLMGPAGWLLRTPYIYSVPMLSAQFFFMAGLYSMLLGLKKTPTHWLAWVLAGIFWVGAIASRTNQIFPVSFMIVMILIWLLKQNERLPNKMMTSISRMVPLITPLAIGMIGLGLYNWARFDSVFETGIYYQLTGPYLQKNWHDLFSSSYVLQNLFNYLLIPPEVQMRFPFLNPTKGNTSPILFSFPEIYYSQEITGIIICAPFVLFAIVSVVHLLRVKRDPDKYQIHNEKDDSPFIRWLTVGLLGSFLTGFAFYLPFFWVATRYVEDFFPPLALLSILGFFQGYRYFGRNPARRVVYALVGVSLAIISVVASLLLAIAINSSGFRESNPVLWRQLVAFFSP